MPQEHRLPFAASPAPQQRPPASPWDPHPSESPFAQVPSHLENLAYQDQLSPHDNPGLHIANPSLEHASISDAAFLNQDYLTSPISPPNGSTSASAMSAGQFYGMIDPALGSNEELIAAAIEEDKRRRNTAASARFRLKKKEREADLEKRTRDMSDRCEELQKRISALETENRWLRELITERSRNQGGTRRRGRDRSSDKDEVKERGSGMRRK